MLLSVITINRNNVDGLRKTMESVLSQSYTDFEYIVVDGASSDESVDVIKSFEGKISPQMVWLSEPDSGIYNAMNKGIRMAHGEYIQILNSGDCLASTDVIEALNTLVKETIAASGHHVSNGVSVGVPEILYGNMVRIDNHGKEIGRSREIDFSLRQFFVGTLNHDCCWIKRTLFEKFGYYDESLKIVADWKWFLQTIAIGGVKPTYINKDVTLFDCTGVSERKLAERNNERRKVLEEVLPPAVLADYDKYSFVIEQTDRLRKYHLYGFIYFIERVIFKLEKWHLLS